MDATITTSARELLEAYRTRAKELHRELEQERQESARLRQRIETLQTGIREGWDQRCADCGGVKPEVKPEPACACLSAGRLPDGGSAAERAP